MSDKVLVFWQVDDETRPGSRILRAPSTGGTIRADKNSVYVEGNLTNVSGEESDEMPDAMRQAVSFHEGARKEFAARRKALDTPVSTPAAVPAPAAENKKG